MSNFNIFFKNGWLLLLLIPAAAVALIPYLRIKRKYRFTRNRVAAMILFFLTALLGVSVLSGVAYSYEQPVETNELIILADWSFSNRQSQTEKEEYIDSVIAASDGTYRISVITFGKDQVVAAEFNNDIAAVRQSFKNREKDPNPSATNIADALMFAADRFTSVVDEKKAGKILLISDGIETDSSAKLAIVNIAARGIMVDTVYFPDQYNSEIQVSGITLPDKNINVDESIKINVIIDSSIEISNQSKVQLKFYDNGNIFKFGANEYLNTKIGLGNQAIEFSYTFTVSGNHELCAEIMVDGDDEISYNNVYYTYIFIETHDKILVIDGSGDDSKAFVDMMNDQQKGFKFSANGGLDVEKAADIRDEWAESPWTLDMLRQWDQLILVNINGPHVRQPTDSDPKERISDLPVAFFDLLYSYVNDVGGGLLTIGGDYGETDNVYGNLRPHAYNRIDMAGSKIQQLLPVEAIDFTPPLALMMVIDRSGSMSGIVPNSGNRTRMEVAAGAVEACIESLTYRDYVGLISFDNDASIEIGLTSVQNKDLIMDVANSITPRGGTVYRSAIETAISQLKAQQGVEKRHIMLISDGKPADQGVYLDAVASAYKNDNITFSCFGIEGDGLNKDDELSPNALKDIVAAGGNKGMVHISNGDFALIANAMKDDLSSVSIRSMDVKPFTPTISSTTADEIAPLVGKSLPEVGGIYPTKVKSQATQILRNEHVPLYAKWSFGAGKVGSFTSTLGAEAYDLATGIRTTSWTAAFMADENCREFIFAMIRGLLPSHSVRPPSIPYNLKEDNYKRELILPSRLEPNETYDIKVYHPVQNANFLTDRSIVFTTAIKNNTNMLVETLNFDYDSNRTSFEVFASGVYYIEFQRLDANKDPIFGTLTSVITVFSYSDEYDAFADKAVAEELMTSIAALSDGAVLTTNLPQKAYEGMLPPYLVIKNPRTTLIVIALILFLLCVLIKRFKWKWPWEIAQNKKFKTEFKGRA